MEAMRALKRRLSDVVYRQLVNDQKQQNAGEDLQNAEARRTGPEGHAGATTKSCAARSNPTHAVEPMVHWAMTGPPTTRGLLDNRAPTRRSGRPGALVSSRRAPFRIWVFCAHARHVGLVR